MSVASAVFFPFYRYQYQLNERWWSGRDGWAEVYPNWLIEVGRRRTVC